jgi:diguanylate cyclase (GGDEF)-like protein
MAAPAITPRRASWRLAAALAVVYLAAAQFGLRFATVNPSTTLIWAPSGLALAALLRYGRGLWPGVFAGALAANLLVAGSLLSSVGIAAGNTLEAVLAASLLLRFSSGARCAERPLDLLGLAGYGALLSTTASATAGVTSLALAGLAPWSQRGSIWLTWWLGDAIGMLLVTPLLLVWTNGRPFDWGPRQVLELCVLLAGTSLGALLVFGAFSGPREVRYPLDFLCLPLLVVTAYRLGPRASALSVVALAAISTYGTLRRAGPFAGFPPGTSLLLLYGFLGVTSLTVQILAALLTERRQLEGRLRRRAESDALTGLANYRQLRKLLHQEMRRSQQDGVPFSLLLLDLDGLKKINDRFGHVAGSHSILRVAQATRACCREIDTAARYGGDEFALLLPGADSATALAVAARVEEWLERKADAPRVSVSIGVSEYPRDGTTLAALLRAADAGLYGAKEAKRRAAQAASQ